MLSEISQTEKDKYHMSHLHMESKPTTTTNLIDMENRLVVA